MTSGSLLSDKEKEVLRLIGCGKSSWEISRILSISVRTVNFHAENILEKLDAANRAHAVAIAIQRGLIDIA